MGSKYHVRSISLPSRSHPITLRIEDELYMLKTWEASSSSSSISTCDSIFSSLSALEDLYRCMDDLLHMPSTQQVLSRHQHEKCIDELLDGSVSLLDMCGIASDTMFEIKTRVHALQSALRRRKRDSSIEDNILGYNKFRKEMKKKGKKLITELKQMRNKKLGASSPFMDQEHDHHFLAVMSVLTQVSAINTSIFQSLFTFLSAPVSSNQTRWSLVSKMMHKGVVSSEENVNELESVDIALSRHGFDSEKMQIAYEKLVALESGIEGLENSLECVLRQLIKARTSLLNIISQ